MKENRLIGYTLRGSGILKGQQIANYYDGPVPQQPLEKGSEAVEAKQDATHMAALVQNKTPNLGTVDTKGVVANQTRAAAGAPLQNASSGAGGVAGQTGSTANASTMNTPDGSGVIERTARARIRAQNPGWTDAQVEQQYQQSKIAAAETMTNTGRGAEFDSNGHLIAFRNNPAQRAQADRSAEEQARIGEIRGYKSIPVYDDKGNLIGYNQVEDRAETIRLQAEATNAAKIEESNNRNAAATKTANERATDNPTNAGGATATDVTEGGATDVPEPSPEGFLAGLDDLEKQYAGEAMGPLFNLYKSQYKELQAKGLRGQALLAEIQKKTDAYVSQARADSAAMEKAWTAMYDNIKQSSLASAKRTYDQQSRLAEQQKKHDQLEYDRAIRDQNIRNEEDRQKLLMGNGISGGWRSSMHTARMIDAFKKADNTIADLETDKIYNSDAWADKFMDIEDKYHGNITAAYDAHNVSLLQLQDKLDARAQALDKTVYDNDVNQINATNKLVEDWYAGISEIAKSTTSTVIQIRQDALAAAEKARDNLRQDQSLIMQEENNFVSRYGDTYPDGWAALQERKKALGLPTYDNIPTLSQADKMAKTAIAKQSQSFILDPKATVGGTNYGILASNAYSASKWSDTDITRGIGDIQALVNAGKISEAKQKILSTTRQGMGETEKNKITSGDSLIQEIGIMNSEISEFSPTYGGFWKNLRESGKPLISMSKDPQYGAVVAHIQRVLGEERHRLFGSALTGNENSQADYYLFNPATDSVADVQYKLKSLNDIARRSRATSYDEVLGSGAYSSLTGENIQSGAPNTGAPMSAPPIPLDTQQQQYDDLLKIWQTPPPSFNSPQSGGGMSSDNLSAWTSSIGTGQEIKGSPFHTGLDQYAIDIDGRIGDPLPSPVSGTIIDVGSGGGYGNYVVIRSAGGFEHLFGHLDSADVSIGQEIGIGGNIGKIGNTGKVLKGKGGDGSHVHYRITQNGKPVDTTKFNVNQRIASNK